MNYQSFKKYIFKTNPEFAHSSAILALKILPNIKPINNYFKSQYQYNNNILHQTIFNVDFNNPVGIGAGFDKNAEVLNGISTLGFGFTEIGTITPLSQDGNPKPRLFRLIEDNSIQNAMGFNNLGGERILKNILSSQRNIPLGINIGKNKLTSEEDALSDYQSLFELFKDQGDYIVINISSPNTPGLRDLQNETFIKNIFTLGTSITNKPILLKIAPDMEVVDAINLCRVAISSGAKGIIATNTTIDYSLSKHSKDFGGISGELLKEKSYKLFKNIGKEFYGKTILISVGGIDSAEEAYKRIKSGASLIQIYSMLIYRGPILVKEINKGLSILLEKDGFSNISEAIGSDWK